MGRAKLTASRPGARSARRDERLEIALRATGEALYDWDIAAGEIYYSEGVYSLLNMPRSMRTPGAWRRRIHPEDLRAYDAAIVAHFKKKTRRFQIDYRFRARDGTWRWARQRGIAQRDKRGRALHLVGTISDVSELKRAEEARRLSDERYELAMRGVNEGVYDWDIGKGTTYYSSRVRAAVGLSGRELRNASDWHKRIHPEDRVRYDAALVAHFKGKTERFECDFRYRGRDGQWHWARQHGMAVRDAKGRAVRLIGSTGNIDELKRAEEALKVSEERYTLAMRAATEGVYEWDLRANTLFVSDTTKVFFWSKSGSFTPDLWNERVHPDDFPAYRDALGAHIRGRTAQFAHEYRVRDARGGYMWVLDRGAAVRDARGRALKFVGAVSDITQRKRAEIEAKEALERQTATAEILKVISESPADTRPTFKAILASTTRVCESHIAALFLYDGKFLTCAAHHNTTPAFGKVLARMRTPPSRETATRLAALTRKVVRVRDYMNDKRFRPMPAQVREKTRSQLAVPLLRDGKLVGVITTWRRELRPFTEKHVALLQTFADQAVIAIENVRLFNETKEALEQQRATADVLAAMSSSMVDAKPVFDAIVRNLRRLFDTRFTVLQLLKGDTIEMPSVDGHPGFEKLMEYYPRPLDRRTGGGIAMLDRRTVQFSSPAEMPPTMAEFAREFGFNSTIFTPMVHQGRVIGAIGAAQLEARPFSERQAELIKTFADQAVIAIENVRLFNETKEALERQTATAEILKVIAASPSDVQPVVEAIAASAPRLLGGLYSVVARKIGDSLHLAAYTGTTEEGDAALRKLFPTRITGQGAMGQAVLRKAAVAVEDIETAPGYSASFREGARARGMRSMLCVPMLREGEVIGVLSVNRARPGPFSEHQTNLLKTFADQAVIAIENVRLFNETREALERQTATADILKVIASSPSDVAPVFQAILRSATRLCDAERGLVFRCDGEFVHCIAGQGLSAEAEKEFFSRPVRPSPISGIGRVIATRKPVQIADVTDDEAYRRGDPLRVRTANLLGARTAMWLPLLKGDSVIGIFAIYRQEVKPFSEQQIALVQTFADQAAIAVENVRLFNETREALERQTATGEILGVISRSHTDIQPVFDAVAATAARLCEAKDAIIQLREGDVFRFVAHHGALPNMPVGGTRPLSRDTVSGRAILEGRQIHIADLQAETRDYPLGSAFARQYDYRTILATPLVRDGRAIGSIMIRRTEARPFTESQLAVVRTFADQAVIAIENVRLFNETKESLERQTATAEILKVIASSPSDTKPVFDAILEGATRLCDAHLGLMNLYEGELFRTVAVRGGKPELAEWAFGRGAFNLSAGAQLIRERRPMQFLDMRDTEGYRAGHPNAVGFVERAGARSLLLVPLLKEGGFLGNIAIYRPEVREFTQKQIDLVSMFASQAVIAMENVRLFNETQEALARQAAAAQVLRAISESVSDTAPVFAAILECCNRLIPTIDYVQVQLIEGSDRVRLVDHRFGQVRGAAPGKQEERKAELMAREAAHFPRPLAGSTLERALNQGRVVILADTLDGPDTPPATRVEAKRWGHSYSQITVPLMREGRCIGAIEAFRRKLGGFEPKESSLLESFADQAVIAIENVRLFNETKEALERQTATAEILKVISSSPTDTQPVFEAIARSVVRLCDGLYTYLGLFDGKMVDFVAFHNVSPEALTILKTRFPSAPDPGSSTGRAILTRAAIHIPDVMADAEYAFKDLAEADGYRAILGVPMLREGSPIGVIAVGRRTPFSGDQIELVKTFADQAVIAIENVRLFKELQQRIG